MPCWLRPDQNVEKLNIIVPRLLRIDLGESVQVSYRYAGIV